MAANNSLPDQATTTQSASMVSFDNNSDYDSESEYFQARDYFDDDSEDEFYEARSTFDNEPDSEQKAVSPLSNKQHPVVPAAAPEPVVSEKTSIESTTKEADSNQEAVSQVSNKQLPVVPAAAPKSVLSEKRKMDDVTQEDQETDSSSPTASSSSCVASQNCPKKPKSVVAFGQTTGFGTIKAPQSSPATGNAAPTANSFAAAKPITFGAMNAPQILPAHGNTAPTFGSFTAAKPFTFGASTTGNNALFSKGSASSPDDKNKENDGVKTTAFGEAPREALASVKETEVVTTGEEDEEIICETKGKLYVMGADNSWKDHGLGTFRLNMDNNTGVRRLVMRTDAVHRLMLNQKLFAGMKVFTMQEKFLRVGALETTTNEAGETETKPVSYALKLASAVEAQELCQKINIYVPKNRMKKRKAYRAAEDDEQASSSQPEASLPLSQKKQRNL